MTDRTNHQDIRIGTLAGQGAKTADYIRQILPHGFESFQINFFKQIPDDVNLPELAKQVNGVLEGSDAIVSSVGVFGNVLEEEKTRADFEAAIDHAKDFGTDLVCGFTGVVTGKSVPDAMPRFKEVWSELTKRAADQGVRIAFENCQMRGSWNQPDFNLAFNPRAWELMFDAVPADNLGLEWEPCHQMLQLIDPLPQLRQWIDKVFHVHGKDATLLHTEIAQYGIACDKPIGYHRTPGFGDTNWADVFTILRQNDYQGTVDIEGWHDPVYKGDLEMTGQVHALNYLKQCRGGDFVANPVV